MEPNYNPMMGGMKGGVLMLGMLAVAAAYGAPSTRPLYRSTKPPKNASEQRAAELKRHKRQIAKASRQRNRGR